MAATFHAPNSTARQTARCMTPMYSALFIFTRYPANAHPNLAVDVLCKARTFLDAVPRESLLHEPEPEPQLFHFRLPVSRLP